MYFYSFCVFLSITLVRNSNSNFPKSKPDWCGEKGKVVGMVHHPHIT